MLLIELNGETRSPGKKIIPEGSCKNNFQIHYKEARQVDDNQYELLNTHVTAISEKKCFCQIDKFKRNTLTHFSTTFHFYTLWKRQKAYDFLAFSGGIEMQH